MIWIIIGIIKPVFASSPEKDKEEKTKKKTIISDNLSSLLPATRTTVTFHIIVLDAEESCDAQDCNLLLIARPATLGCMGVGDDILNRVRYVSGTSDYYLEVTTSNPCVLICFIDNPQGSCKSGFNSISCCEWMNNPQICYLYVCP